MSGTDADSVSMSDADRISSLPDPILHHILSFLKTTEVVSTRILSKNWKHLWTGVPALKFKAYELRDESKFEHFLNFVFEQRQTMSLDTFGLWWGQHCTCTFEAAERWLSHVVKCQPRVVILDTVWIDQYLNFSDYVFSCESLEELTLSTSFFYSTYMEDGKNAYAVKPKSVNLKHLKKLEISGYVNLDDDFMEQLMLGSPVLEELQLSCSYEGLSIISSETLKHLEISWDVSKFMDDWFEISIPSLVYLYIHEDVPGRLHAYNLESLVNAYIHITHCSYVSLAALLCGISNATKLSLYTLDDMSAFEEEMPFCPIFSNLKEMTCKISSFYPVPWLLQHAPNLEKLTLEYYYFGKFDSKLEEENYVGWDLAFTCKKLKMLEIYCFGVEELQDVLNLLSYNKDLANDIEVKLHRRLKWY